MPTIEVLPNSTSISAPGWTYVPDTGYDPSKAPIQAGPRKRNARIAGTSGGDTTARQNTAILKRLADLDKDNSKDVQISIPHKQKDASGRVSKGKTAVTRKILVAQKTFANYIADEEALAALEPQPAAPLKSRASNTTPKRTASTLSREPSSTTAPQALKGSSMHERRPANTNSIVPLPGFVGNDVADSRLLQSSVPEMPSDSLLEALVTAQPLSYNAARAAPSSSGKPQRHFCEFCGYWGQVKSPYNQTIVHQFVKLKPNILSRQQGLPAWNAMMPRPIRIIDIPPAQVEDAPEKFNSAFHTSTEVPTGEERATFEPTYYGSWLPLITTTAGRDIHDVVVVDINNLYADVLVNASKAAIVTGHPWIRARGADRPLPEVGPETCPEEGWFLRLEGVSPKDGIGGVRPRRTLLEILLTLTTSLRASTAIKYQLDRQQPVRLYLIPFNKLMDTSREFRIFCPPGGHIAAISQYKWFRGTTWTDEKVKHIGNGAQHLYHLIMSQDSTSRDEIRKTGFVFDMLYAPGYSHVFQLVELNLFGALTGCGSCLFHWIRDRDILYAANGAGTISFAVSRVPHATVPALPQTA
ncbi:hypothetical protein MMC11_000859 [Xylographa trunciseda]|nr:hypothetical protein [Xylographa trunciseda]